MIEGTNHQFRMEFGVSRKEELLSSCKQGHKCGITALMRLEAL
jgi:hypothetical protein